MTIKTDQRNSLQEVADQILNQVAAGKPVVIEVSAPDTETGALLRLIATLHELAATRQIGVRIEPVREQAIQLTLVTSSETA